jgi:hypothetical protein
MVPNNNRIIVKYKDKNIECFNKKDLIEYMIGLGYEYVYVDINESFICVKKSNEASITYQMEWIKINQNI